MLGFPPYSGITLNVSTAHLPGVEVDLELGRCYFRGNLGKTKASQTEEEQSSYIVNVTNYCPALQVGKSVWCTAACRNLNKLICLSYKYYCYRKLWQHIVISFITV